MHNLLISGILSNKNPSNQNNLACKCTNKKSYLARNEMFFINYLFFLLLSEADV